MAENEGRFRNAGSDRPGSSGARSPAHSAGGGQFGRLQRGRIANENRPLLDGNDPGEPPRPQSSVHFFPRRANKIAELALGHA